MASVGCGQYWSLGFGNQLPKSNNQVSITWQNCSLRKWLRQSFLQTAFSDKERKAIREVYLDNNSFSDNVFLLSKQEAEKYLGDRYGRRCAPTYYARSFGAHVEARYNIDGMSGGWWWLRSAGSVKTGADYVDNGGDFATIKVDKDTGGVRPALWISLDAGIF